MKFSLRDVSYTVLASVEFQIQSVICLVLALSCVAAPSILTETTYALFWGSVSPARSGADLVGKVW